MTILHNLEFLLLEQLIIVLCALIRTPTPLLNQSRKQGWEAFVFCGLHLQSPIRGGPSGWGGSLEKTGAAINVQHNIPLNLKCTPEGKGANDNIPKHYSLNKPASKAKNRLEETLQLCFMQTGEASVAAAAA